MSDTWYKMALDNLAASGVLHRRGHQRSAANRAYLAAFAAVTGALARKGTTFSDGREAPGHGVLSKLVQTRLGDLSRAKKQDMKRMIRVLYNLRCQADYSRRSRITPRAVREAINMAVIVVNHARITK